jgi:hypothetical protein
MVPCFEHLLRPLKRWLFDETCNGANIIFAGRGGNIAEAGCWVIGLDPEGYDMAGFGGFPRNPDSGLEGRDIANMMIAGADQQKLFIISPGGSQGDGSGTVALARLQDNCGNFVHQIAQVSFLSAVGDNEGGSEMLSETGEGLLEQAALAQQRKQVFRP